MEGKTVEDYAVNSQGTKNVAHAVKVTSSVARVIFTSTQYVVGPGALPAHDQDFRPHTIYGESKVLSEKAVRSANLSCVWTIVRPTNIWGSWHPRYAREFWLVLKKGLYLHPGPQPVIRSYGYVGNVVLQLERILRSAENSVNGKVFYVGDESINLLEWVNAFSTELTGRKVRVLPRAFLRFLAWVGDSVIALGGRFPIFSSRFRSMTEDYQTPISETFTVLGKPEIPLREGVRETVSWLRTLDEFR
jgi:nucleoside-diphosphate-sugar epimerase